MERRLELRLPADAVVKCRVPATPIAAKVLNISRAGCRLQAERDDIGVKGAMIVLQVSPSFAAAGQIIWLHGKDFGVKFYRPLGDDDLIMVATQDIVATLERP